MTHRPVLKSVWDFFLFENIVHGNSAEKACRNSWNRFFFFFFCTQECWHIKRTTPQGAKKRVFNHGIEERGFYWTPFEYSSSLEEVQQQVRWSNSNVRGLRKSPDLLKSGHSMVSFGSVNISWVLSGLGDFLKVTFHVFWNLVKFYVFLGAVICGYGEIWVLALSKIPRFVDFVKFVFLHFAKIRAFLKTYDDALTSPAPYSNIVVQFVL